MINKTQRITTLGIFTSLAMVLSYIELLLPPVWPAVPGVKIGLPNIIIIFLLYRVSVSAAITVSLIRLCLTALLFGTAMIFVYSLAGAVLSICIMIILKKTDIFSMVGVSIAGGVFHNLGQILAAMIILQTKEIGYYMIFLAVSGILAGVFVGLCGMLLIKYTKKIKF